MADQVVGPVSTSAGERRVCIPATLDDRINLLPNAPPISSQRDTFSEGPATGSFKPQANSAMGQYIQCAREASQDPSAMSGAGKSCQQFRSGEVIA